jgi:hypothetical protein
MYLLGHTNAKLTTEVYQQVFDMGDGGLDTLETAIGWTLDEAFSMVSGRGVSSTNRLPAEKAPPSSAYGVSWKARKRLRRGDFPKAAEGTRTLDLLHGKQTL